MLFTQKLNQNADFQRLYRSGAFCSIGSALLYVRPNKLPFNRLGITASKKIGNAVKRNRAKRFAALAIRLHRYLSLQNLHDDAKRAYYRTPPI